MAHIENGVAHCCAMQMMTKIFTGDVRCKNNDRLVSMHTSDTRRSVWHKNQLLHSFQRGARSLTINMKTKIRDSRMSVFSCGETKVRMAPNGIPMASERSVSEICEILRLC